MAKLLATLKFAEWLPDLPEFDNPGSPNVSNVLWVNGAYAPAQGFSSLGVALPARCQGAYAALDDTGGLHVYAGIATQLLEYSGTGFTDRSGASYTTADGQYWKFGEFSSPGFGNLIIATNFADPVQAMETGDTAFAALAGSPPRASALGVIGQFVMLGNTEEAVNGAAPYRVQWCGIANPNYWAFGTLAAQQAQAGEQFLNAVYGPVTHISDGSQFGLIFQQRGITRAYYTGDDAIFAFDTYEKQRGALFPNACVQIGNLTYFIAADGFCVTDGQQVTPIGHGKVDSTVLADLAQNYGDRVRGSVDPKNKLILWSYCSGGNSTGIPDKVIAYNYAEGRFTPVGLSLSLVFTTQSFGYTMDTLDNVNVNLDLITPSLDSPSWEGGNQEVGAFDGSNLYGGLGGAALVASLDTAEAAPNPGGLTYIDGIRPVVTDPDGTGSLNAQALTRQLENGSYTVSAAAEQNISTGRCDLRASGRYVRARVSITGGFGKAVGADIYGTGGGER